MIRFGCISILFVGTFLKAAEPLKLSFSGVPGPYTAERWKKDWPGCDFEDGVKEGHLSLVEDEARNWLRVRYVIGQIGPEKNGTGWRFPFGKHLEAELRYTVRFGADFDWVKGGKLPGLCGGPDNVSGGRPATGTNGFSARLMWRKEGRGEAYVYHKNQADNYGDSFAFPADFRFPTEKPIRVRMRVAMNDVGKRNGKLNVWIAVGETPELQVVSRADMEWRTVDSFGVDSLYFESFYGGSDSTWAPTRDSHADFTDIRVDFE